MSYNVLKIYYEKYIEFQLYINIKSNHHLDVQLFDDIAFFVDQVNSIYVKVFAK